MSLSPAGLVAPSASLRSALARGSVTRHGRASLGHGHGPLVPQGGRKRAAHSPVSQPSATVHRYCRILFGLKLATERVSQSSVS